MFDDDLFSGMAEPQSGNERAPADEDLKRPTSTGFGTTTPPTAPAPSAAAPAVALSPRRAAVGAGVSLLVAAAGLGAGALLGGLWGAGAGLLMAGALRNGARAHKLWQSPDDSDRQEAVSSATMAVIGTGAGGYLAYRAYQEQRLE